MSFDDLTDLEELAMVSAVEDIERTVPLANNMKTASNGIQPIEQQNKPDNSRDDDIERTAPLANNMKTASNGIQPIEQQNQPDNSRDDEYAIFKKPTSVQFSLQFQKGDLFSCPPTDSLAHCVSLDLRMGKGIAVLFKQKFEGIAELKQQAHRVGNVAVLKRNSRYIYYLITKPKYNNKPTYQTLETTLRGMKHHCVKYGVKRLSMPRIGCGLDRLMWSQVENLLRKVFSDTDMTVTVYSI